MAGQRLLERGFLLAMGGGWGLITLASLEYFDATRVAPFVLERLPVRFEALWLRALPVHVASALVSFPLCFAAATRSLRRRPGLHRWVGRLAGALVILALVPSGLVLAFEAKGGAPVTLGFLLSAAIVLGAMLSGVAAARRGDGERHARMMRHVLAQMSVAVTSRAMLVAFERAGVDAERAYVLALWLPVLLSAGVAEWLSTPPTRPALTARFPSPRSSP